MKLWQKIFLSTLALMALSTALVSILLLRSSRDALWGRESQRVVTRSDIWPGCSGRGWSTAASRPARCS